MIGEKFIERKIEGNKIIVINEFKDFEDDYEKIVDWINDCVTDDWEDQYYTYGITSGDAEYYTLECDQAIEGLGELLIEWETENKEGEEHDVEKLKEIISTLEKAEGFIIHFRRPEGYYTKNFKATDEK